MSAPVIYPYPPHAMCEAEAARYVGVSVTAFRDHPHRPAEVWITERRKVFRREDLEQMVDAMAGLPVASPDKGYSNGW